MKRLKNDRGFTLIELLVAIAILALIGGLVVPRYVGVYADSKGKTADAELQLVQAAVDRYVIDEEKKNTALFTIYNTLSTTAVDPAIASNAALEALDAAKYANLKISALTSKYLKKPTSTISDTTYKLTKDFEVIKP